MNEKDESDKNFYHIKDKQILNSGGRSEIGYEERLLRNFGCE